MRNIYILLLLSFGLSQDNTVHFGTGADGELYVGSNETYYTDANRTTALGDNFAGGNIFNVGDATGFETGDEVLIISMQDPNTNLDQNVTGTYETHYIESVDGNALTLAATLENDYLTSTGAKHQVVRVPNYTNVTVDGTMTCANWNGATGGVVFFRVSSTSTINGTIDASGKGYRGVSHACMYRNQNGYQGEGIFGTGVKNINPNSNGGGGGVRDGYHDGSGGGGGGYLTNGENGDPHNDNPGAFGGLEIGENTISKIFLGGAGGEGAADEDGGNPGAGGNGGGAIYYISENNIGNGNVTSNGNNGIAGCQSCCGGTGGGMAAGGGGSGGSIILISTPNIDYTISATGGIGGTYASNGGNGSDGRIRIDILGCTDEYADSYDETATVDDGSCTYPDNGDYSLSFDGEDDYVEVLDSPTFFLGNSDFTFQVDVLFKSFPGGCSGGDNPYIFGWFLNSDDAIMLGRYCNNTIRFIIDQGEVVLIDADVINEIDVWYNFTITKSENNYKLYQNSVLIGAVTSALPYPDVAANLIIGGTSPSSQQNLHHGEIDNLRFWNIALHQEEISSNMLQTINYTSLDLISNYKFNAGSGDILYDHSGNGNHGAINGATWYENTYGCPDPDACNYDPDVDFHDPALCDYTTDLCGVCVIDGGDNSSCQGCMQSEASNYNPDATIDDGSCMFFPDVDDDFTFGGIFDGSYYFHSSNSAIWTTAKSICEQNGGHLATISSFDENMFVSNLAPNDPLWIGFTDENSEGIFYWITGEAVTYTNWPSPQPDNAGGNEDYVHTNWNSVGGWNDQSSNYSSRFVLEIEYNFLGGCTDSLTSNYNPEANYDDGSCEYNFDYEQSSSQAFYFMREAEIDGWPILSGDLIVAYKADENGWPTGDPIGGAVWPGETMEVVVMGNDGDDYTSEYLQPGDFPAFRIYSYSLNRLYDARASEPLESFSNLNIQIVDKLEVTYDCMGLLGGHANVDYCGDCVEGTSDGIMGQSDGDGDGVCDAGAPLFDPESSEYCPDCLPDNCPETENPGQDDFDADQIGDICDPDDDNDGCLDDEDTEPFAYSADPDADGIGNDCDVCPNDAENDIDGDGVCCSDGDPFCYDSEDDIDGDGLGCNLEGEGIPVEDLCCFDPQNDEDGDGLCCNTVENSPEDDVCCTDPLNDEDGDGICGDMTGFDACPGGDDNYDTDGDGTPNDCDVDLDLDHAPTLVSFHALPEDASIENMFTNHECDFQTVIQTVITAGGATTRDDESDEWLGSLEYMDCSLGYWLIMNEDTFCEYDLVGNGLDGNFCSAYGQSITYIFDQLAKLISYPYSINQPVGDYICESGSINGIISQNIAATCDENGNLMGSLENFVPGAGYWFKTNGTGTSFEYPVPDPSNLSREIAKLPAVPIEYRYRQSTQQAFYFITELDLVNSSINIGDWIVAYNGVIVVGARMWTGKYTDVPVMGSDGNPKTVGYCEEGDIPTFKILRIQSGEMLEMNSVGIPPWNDLGLEIISLAQNSIPTDFILDKAYPNPFNPVTTLSFAIPVDSEVSLSIYNLQGREVSTLIDGNMDAGYHSVVWNADSYSSGVYFVKMVAGEYVNTQKLMLVK